MSNELEKKSNGPKLSFGSSDFDSEAYAQVARQAKLFDVRIVKGDFKVHPEAMALLYGSEANYDLLYDGSVSSFSFGEDSGAAVGGYKWNATVKVERRVVFQAKSQFFVGYRGLGGAQRDYVEMYFFKLSRFTTYPYFRAYVGNCAVSAGIVLPPLPSLVDRVD